MMTASPPSTSSPPRRARLVIGAFALAVAAACTPVAASDDDDNAGSVGQSTTFDSASVDGGDSSSSGGSPPTTPEECHEAYLADRGDNCDLEPCLGGVLSCVNLYDCPTCTSQCFPPQCSTDAECQDQFGDLCPGVNWVCDQYLTSTFCGVDWGDGGSTGEGSTSTGPDWGGSTTGGVGCDAGDPYECAGDMLRDCATGELADCEQLCIDAGYSGVADPPCGLGSDGYELCLCE